RMSAASVRLRVVLLTVDAARDAVLLALDEGALARGQRSAVGRAHCADLAVQMGLAALEPRGLPRRQLSARDALRDALLLPVLAVRDRSGFGGLRGRQRRGDERPEDEDGERLAVHVSCLREIRRAAWRAVYRPAGPRRLRRAPDPHSSSCGPAPS